MFGWLMPDATHQALFEGWDRQHYRPRHGRPPLVVRGAHSAAIVIARARERYLGAGEEESLAGASGRRPQRADLYLNTQRRRRWREQLCVGWLWRSLLRDRQNQSSISSSGPVG
jgi:hypothetical protein